jgi:hypothetical protein
MNVDKNVTAKFETVFTLSVNRTPREVGNEELPGYVVSVAATDARDATSPFGEPLIVCGKGCRSQQHVVSGNQKLRATVTIPPPGGLLNRWTGACAGATGPICFVTVTADHVQLGYAFQ